MKRKFLALLLILCCICSQSGMVTFAAEIGEQNSEITGTLGENGGFEWSYESETKTLRVTGEDTNIGSIPEVIELEYPVEHVIFENCVFSGSMSYLLGHKNFNSYLLSCKFDNCDTSDVTDMSGMFYGCTNVVSIDLTGLDTSNVRDMSDMFYNCWDLPKIDLTGLDTSNVRDMSSMFYRCSSMSEIDLRGLDTSNVRDMLGMFYDCNEAETINLNGLDTSNVRDMSDMFYNCGSAKVIDVGGIDTSNVTNMSRMFMECRYVEYLDVSGFDTSKVTDMSDMFKRCYCLKELDVSGFDTSNVVEMDYMFYNCENLEYLDVSVFDTSNVTKIHSMFWFCTNLKILDLSGFNMSNISSYMSNIIDRCDNLEVVYTPRNVVYSIALPNTFYDLYSNPVTEINSELSDTILTRNTNIRVHNNVIIDTTKTNLVKVRNSYGKPMSEVTISYGGNVVTTDANGEVLIDKEALFASDKLSVSKEGYCTWSVDVSVIGKDTFDIEVMLYKIGEEDLVLKYANHYGTDSGTIDLLSKTKAYNIKNVNDIIKISSKAMNPDKVVEYQLWQKDKKIATSSNGEFQLTVGDGFTEGGNCFIRVIGKTGLTRDAYINLSFVSINVSGSKDVNLMDSSLSIDVSEKVPFFGGEDIEFDLPSLPIDVKQSEDKIYIGINLDTSGEGIKEDLDDYFSDLKDSLDAAKKASQIKLGKKNAKDMKKYIKDTKAFKLPGGDFDVDIVGYAECYVGEMEAKGGIYISIEAESPTLGFTTWVVVVPVTVHFKATAEMNATAEISYDLVTGEFDGALNLDIEIGLEAFGGVGVGKAAGIGAYGEAGVLIDMKLLTENSGVQKVKLKGELGVTAYIGPFAYKKSFAEKTWTLYSAKTKKYALLERMRYGLYDAGNYEIESLDYLLEESGWNGYPTMHNEVEVTTEFMELLENSYHNAQPVMVAWGDVLYAAFLGADKDTGEIYVQCTKMENGVWCEPVRLDSEAVLDDAPQLLVDKAGNIWLVYAKTGAGYENGNLVSYAKNQKMVVGMLDKSTLTLTNSREYSSDNYMHMQQISLVDGVPTVAWVESVVTDPNSVLSSLENKIVSVSYSNGQWSAPLLAKNIDGHINDMAIGDVGVGYTIDVDGDLTTFSDNNFVYCDWQGNIKKTIEGVTGNITYGTLPGETQSTFIWNDTDKLCSVDKFIDVVGITNEYLINNNSIYYSTPVEGGAELAVIRKNNDGTFTSPLLLTKADRYIENISVATVYGKDVVLGMHTNAEITEDNINTSKNLVWYMVQSVNDIRIDDVYYDEKNIAPGEEVEITLTVTNAGENQLENLGISLGDEVISTQSIGLKPGESKDVTFKLICPDKFTAYNVKVEDTDSDILLDYNPDDNDADIELGYANLQVEATLKNICNEKTIVALISNTGIEKASGNIVLYNEEGDILTISAIKDLERGKTLYVELPVDSDISNTTLSVVVNGQQEELYTHDNVYTVYIPMEDAAYSISYELDGGIQNNDNPSRYYESDGEIQLLAPTKKGYKFEGWYSDSNYTIAMKSISSDSIGDITLYAKWTAEAPKEGLQKAANGKWYYYVNNEIDTTYVGLAKNDNGWWYIKNGTVDFSYTGMAKNENGWFYVKKGKLDLTYTGLAENEHGTWYMVNGKVASNVSGLTKISKKWMYLSKGKVDTSYVGLAKNDSGWWYVENGTVDFTYTGMAKNQYGWWYVKNGKLDRTYTGLATNEHGTWYMVNGQLAKDVSGLTKVSKKWMYLVKGKVDTDYVGLAKNESGWWYVKNGTVDFTYTGMAKNQYGWWYVTNGQLDRSFTGIASNEYGSWYIKNGAVEKTYTGTVTFNGVTYNVKNGKVV